MGEESPKPASAPTGAVFLSYASQDVSAARRICDALRAAGIDVWLDQSELRGGDAWDRKIRDQIRHCALFIPVISAHSQARLEGYFRREWKFAVERKRDIADELAFLLPVVIDETPERGASVPEGFHEVQWTRLPEGVASQEFVEHVSSLLTGNKADRSKPAAQALQPSAAPVLVQPAAESTSGSPMRMRVLLVAAAIAVIIGYIGVDRYLLHKGTRLSAASATAASADKSVAVLPFADLSEQHDQEYFADGIAEETLNQLVKIPGLKVIGRTSSFQFKGKADDVRKIGATLGAAYVLEGSVRKSADRVRVTAQLISTGDGAHRWSNTYDAKLDDVLKVQDDLAASLARALELTVDAPPATDPVGTNPEAYDLYLRGLHALDAMSLEGCEQAIELLNQALRLEPTSTRTLASLAWSHDCIGFGGWLIPGAGFPQARELARRLLASDPKSADAHLILADANLVHDWDWAAVKREIDAAFALAPADPRAFYIAAGLATAQWQNELATELLQQSLARDPLNARTYDRLCSVYYRTGRYVEAEAMCRRVLQIAPQFGTAHYWLSVAILMQNRLEDALAETQRATPDEGQYVGGAAVLYAMHRQVESNAALEKAIEVNRIDWPSGIARAYAFRGDRDQAMVWLERAYEARDGDMFFIKGDPQLQSLESDPRYRAFLRKMNLPE